MAAFEVFKNITRDFENKQLGIASLIFLKKHEIHNLIIVGCHRNHKRAIYFAIVRKVQIASFRSTMSREI